MSNQAIIKDIEGTSFSVRTENGGYRKFTVADIFNIDETDITKEFMQQASLYGFFATISAMAEDVANRADFDKDQEYAQADIAWRESFEQNSRKYTEAVVRSTVMTDAGYVRAVERHLKTEYDFKLLKAIVRALEQRADMLVSLGSHLRHEEGMTGMTIKERQLQAQENDIKSILRKARQNPDEQV